MPVTVFPLEKLYFFSKTRMFLKKTIPCPAWMLELFPKKCDSFLHKKLYFFSKTGTFLKKTIPCPQGSGLANACDSFSIGKTVLFSKTRMFLKKQSLVQHGCWNFFPKKIIFFFDFFHVFLHRNQLLRCRQKTAHPLFICQ